MAKDKQLNKDHYINTALTIEEKGRISSLSGIKKNDLKKRR